ncbi:potassium-transporting ATPase subunit KdpC [Sphingobium terrigena]|uniref:Potassium-transporting ATPase KdpC subunit n=1 Tax=Sphingobium terrigena TaxID=2304063 RepID=A0A418YXZ4_9SPHN|nr:potassium-transporting ATPase subunit KdpC [Sphingobium terrigena]RJG57737.1 potassium-transporting ATPase subunit KdpC [Sphingobium terrigena]
MGKDFLTSLRPAFTLTILFALLLGIVYPLTMTGIGQTLFPHQANGSLVEEQGKPVGSSLIGQGFADPRYFSSRPSAAGKGYDGLASSGSNFGPTSQALVDRTKADVAKFQQMSPGLPVPSDLVTASASGLDPDISPEAAFYQVARVAAVRGLPAARVRALVQDTIRTPFLGFLGDPSVNILDLNRRLDRISATTAQ